jgi:putative endonuclease
MPVVYVLKSASTGKFYVGCTLDFPRRWAEHLRGQSPFTRNRGPWEVVHQEQYATMAEARRRERQIKSWKSHRSIQQLIDSSVG